jgi:hypothetical protein
LDKTKFTKDILPVLFKHKNYPSFVRQVRARRVKVAVDEIFWFQATEKERGTLLLFERIPENKVTVGSP